MPSDDDPDEYVEVEVEDSDEYTEVEVEGPDDPGLHPTSTPSAPVQQGARTGGRAKAAPAQPLHLVKYNFWKKLNFRRVKKLMKKRSTQNRVRAMAVAAERGNGGEGEGGGL